MSDKINDAEVHTRSPVVDFYYDVTEYVKIQAGLHNSGDGAHPDNSIRAFSLGLFNHLQQPKFEFLLCVEKVRKSYTETGRLDAGHFVDLLARAIQYMLRSQQQLEIQSYTATEWEHYFDALTLSEFKQLEDILTKYQVATHVPARYRSLSALAVVLQNLIDRPLRIADIGCSLNLGIPLAVFPNIIATKTHPPLTDDATPGALITRLLEEDIVDLESGIGIDLHIPDFAWVAACSYFSQYTQHLTELTRIQEICSKMQLPIYSKVGDITEMRTVELLKTQDGLKPHIIHAAMSLYQLSPTSKQQALSTICQALDDSGFFIELTFVDAKNWFLDWNIQTSIQIKQEDGSLSRPYQWLLWNNSRCSNVKSGSDFAVVNTLLDINLSSVRQPKEHTVLMTI